MKKKLLSLWGMTIVIFITALVLTSATFAWFASNQEVGTNRVMARVGGYDLELQISRRGPEPFRPDTDSIVTLMPPANVLMPVSTADLESFVYNRVTVNGIAQDFLLTEDETMYFHDTLYLRAKSSNLPEGSKMVLYLDNTDYPIVEATYGELINAARLGLTFDGGSPVIVSLSQIDDGPGNTGLDGVAVEPGHVLSWADGEITAVPDPALPLSEVQATATGGHGKTPLTKLEVNKVYTVDIYFYLEGCDPDCLSERVAMDRAALTVSFFGLLDDLEDQEAQA